MSFEEFLKFVRLMLDGKVTGFPRSIPGVTRPATGEELRDAGIKLVLENNRIWAAKLKGIVRWLAMRNEEITSDIVKLRCLEIGDVRLIPENGNAWGGLMRTINKEGGVYIGTDLWVPSIFPENHARPIRVWRSLLFNQARLSETGT